MTRTAIGTARVPNAMDAWHAGRRRRVLRGSLASVADGVIAFGGLMALDAGTAMGLTGLPAGRAGVTLGLALVSGGLAAITGANARRRAKVAAPQPARPALRVVGVLRDAA